MKKTIRLVILLVAATLLAACQVAGSTPDKQTAGTEEPAETATELPETPPVGETQTGDNYPKAVLAARAALAASLGVEEAAISVSTFETRDWPDACLGAAQKDEMCAQVITPGYRVELAVGEIIHVAHTSLSGAEVRWEPCGVPAADLDSKAAEDAVRTELANYLNASIDEVTIISVEAVDWPDACLGLAKPGISCAAMIVPGFRITAQVKGITYVYRTDKTGKIAVREEIESKT